MKQFYETYCSDSECYKLWYNLQDDKKPNILSQIVSAVLTQITWKYYQGVNQQKRNFLCCQVFPPDSECLPATTFWQAGREETPDTTQNTRV